MHSTESTPDSLQDAIHVWRMRLGEVAATDEHLSPRERLRASRFRFARDRERFVAAHSALRQILGGYLSLPPYAVELRTGEHGKPALSDQAGLQFSLSHAGGAAVVAVASGIEVGVDVEAASTLVDPEAVVERAMTAGERKALGSLPPDRTRDAILATWVRKEAVAKVRGQGMQLSFDLIETSPDKPANGDQVIVRVSPADTLYIWDIPMASGLTAALAGTAGDVAIELIDFPGAGHGHSLVAAPATSTSLTA
jgi:4'-phosphopantetheinyl transferase